MTIAIFAPSVTSVTFGERWDAAQGQKPATPINIVGTPQDSAVGLTWTASAGATGYRIYEDNSGVYTLLLDVPTAPTTVPGLTNGVQVALAVSAYNDTGESNPSPDLLITPSAGGGAPVVCN